MGEVTILELVYLVIWVGLAFLAVFCVTILSIILEPVGATARSSRTGWYLGVMFVPTLGASLVLINGLLLIAWRSLALGPLLLLIAGAGVGFLTLVSSPFASWWSWQRFGRVYYPILLGSILISLAAQYAAGHLIPAPTYYVECRFSQRESPEPPLNMRLGDTLESRPYWMVNPPAGSDPAAIPLARVPLPLLPIAASERWRAVQTGTLELHLETYTRGGPSDECRIPITIHGNTP